MADEILRKGQASIAEFRAKTDERFNRLEADARKDPCDINGSMALLQAASGDFDERIRDIDDRVSVLEDRAS